MNMRVVAMVLLAAARTALAADSGPDDRAVVDALRKGGCYVVMRHASSPRDPPPAGDAVPGNTGGERQLDAKGRATARAMGEALRRLHVPIGEVLSSPTWRAQETANEAGLPKPRLVKELGDGGQSMSAAGDAQAAWLRQQVTRPVARGNTIVITHFPNLRAAFPEHSASLEDGEALIFAPASGGEARLLRRVRIEEWPSLGRGG